MNQNLLRALLPLGLAVLLSACASRQAATPAVVPPAARLAPMPEAVTSFAAVTHDGWLYVAGGHKGERHDYNVDMVSGGFFRLRLAEGSPWETLPALPPVQGVPLVAHGQNLYRIGGMAARNPAGTKQDLFSYADVWRFDLPAMRWEKFTPLPEPRSSHDAVVLGDRLYVGGGWQLTGGTNKPVWPDYALVFDFKNPRAGWQKMPQPFQRRALAMAALDTRLFFIGGMNADGSPTLAVDVYDTATGRWAAGPELPPGKFKGFACSAITQDGRVYANTFQGDLLRLAADAKSWEVVGRVQNPRMAHRLVTAGTSQLIVLGGEDGESKRPDLELLTPAAVPALASGQAALTTTK